MANTKLKLALAGLVVAGAAATMVSQHQAQQVLREENVSLGQQIAQLQAEKGKPGAGGGAIEQAGGADAERAVE